MTITNNRPRLMRSNGMLAGVCGGLAEFCGLDASLIRIATLILILFGGLSVWIYILLWIIIPKAPKVVKA